MTKAIATTKSTTIKPSEAELSMLSAAARRADRCLAPVQKPKSTMARKLVDKLKEAGLVREVRAKPDMPVWRRDDETGLDYSLKLTAAGARAVAVPEHEELARQTGEGNGVVVVNGSPPRPASERWESNCGVTMTSNDVVPPESAVLSGDGGSGDGSIEPGESIEPEAGLSAAPRLGSKIAAVLERLARVDGASLDELIGATGWLPHTARAALTGLRQRGYAIERNRENSVTRYRVMNAPVRRASTETQDQRAPDSVHDDRHRAPRAAAGKKASAHRISAATEAPGAP